MKEAVSISEPRHAIISGLSAAHFREHLLSIGCTLIVSLANCQLAMIIRMRGDLFNAGKYIIISEACCFLSNVLSLVQYGPEFSWICYMKNTNHVI